MKVSYTVHSSTLCPVPAESTASMPSYEVPHPALSLTAISQGKGKKGTCMPCALDRLVSRCKSRMAAKTPK